TEPRRPSPGRYVLSGRKERGLGGSEMVTLDTDAGRIHGQRQDWAEAGRTDGGKEREETGRPDDYALSGERGFPGQLSSNRPSLPPEKEILAYARPIDLSTTKIDDLVAPTYLLQSMDH